MKATSGWRPHLVALDVDGTLQEPGRAIALAVRTAVRRAASAGARIVLASGRCPEEVAPIFHDLDLPDGYAICSNGAVTVHYPDMEILRAVTFEPAEALGLVLGHVPHALVAVDEPGFGYGVTSYFPLDELPGPQALRSLEQMLAQPAIRVIVRDPAGTVAGFLDMTRQLNLTGVSYAVGYKAWLDIWAAGVSKGSALDKLAAELGVDPAFCLAIGDGRNDLEMLTWAGHGVAMGNAPAEVQAAADAVTGLVSEHGAATELLRWF